MSYEHPFAVDNLLANKRQAHVSLKQKLDEMLGESVDEGTWLRYGRDSSDPAATTAWLMENQIGFFNHNGWTVVDSFEEFFEHAMGVLLSLQEQEEPYASEGRFEEHM